MATESNVHEGEFPKSRFETVARYRTLVNAKPNGPGRLRVWLSREGWGGPSPPAAITVKVGSLAGVNGSPAIGAVTASRVSTRRRRVTRRFTLPAPGVPYRLEIHVGSTFSLADYGYPDTRQLGAQADVEAR